MTTSVDMLYSLGFYVHLKMVAGVAKNDCQRIADYHVFLQNVEAQAGASAVVGRVQSGKTRNYIGLMLKAVDEGWNVLVILTSASTALADQTESRIEKDFARSEAYDGHKVNFRVAALPPSADGASVADRVCVLLGRCHEGDSHPRQHPALVFRE